MTTSFSSSSEMQRNSGSSGAERRLKELGIKLSAPPQPFGTYAEAVQTGNLLFLSGMLPTEGAVRSLSDAWELSSTPRQAGRRPS
jgi:hypothetical protein